jgi:hypothetical protein
MKIYARITVKAVPDGKNVRNWEIRSQALLKVEKNHLLCVLFND